MAKDKLTTRDGAEDELDKSSALRAPKVTELIPMSGIRGIYQKVKRKVGKIILAATVSSVASAGVGEYARDKYRDIMSYHPQTESPAKSDKNNHETSKGDKSTFGSMAEKAKSYGAEAVDAIVDKTELGKKYAEMKKQYEWLLNIRENLLDAGDKLVYYAAIVLTFLAMVKLLSMMNKLLHPVDSVVEENMIILKEAVNRIERRQAPEGAKKNVRIMAESAEETRLLRDSLDVVGRSVMRK